MVLIYSVCGLVRVLLYVLGEELQGFKQAQQTYSMHTHTRTHTVCDISLVQDMAGVQGQHKGRTLESSHSETSAAPQSLKLAFSPAALSLLSEVIRGGGAAFYLKPAERK